MNEVLTRWESIEEYIGACFPHGRAGSFFDALHHTLLLPFPSALTCFPIFFDLPVLGWGGNDTFLGKPDIDFIFLLSSR